MDPVRTDAPEMAPAPVVFVPDFDDAPETVAEREQARAAAVVTVWRLVVRRAAWAVAPILAALARWLGDTAATAARREYAARLELVVVRYEARIRAEKMRTVAETERADALDLECQAMTLMYARLQSVLERDTAVNRIMEAGIGRGQR